MKLLVFAHTPPPVHGQSLAVQALLDCLPRVAPEIELFHVNPRLSRDTADIGRWRPGKLLRLLGACARALALRVRHGPMWFYYVPAPAKRGALYRDWIVLLLCRPFFRGVVLHWHAVGLGAWLDTRATAPERAISRALLGRAQLALVLAEAVRADAEKLAPRACIVVSPGIADDAADFVRAPYSRTRPLEVLFLSLGSREKGLFDALEGIALAHRQGLPCRLTVAGAFADADTARSFHARAAELGPDLVRHLGFVSIEERHRLFAMSDVLCFPTYYPYEGLPAVLLEALSFDLPIVTTRWRAIPEMLPREHVWFVAPQNPAEIAAALAAVAAAPAPEGALRAVYSARFTRERHLAALAEALRSLPA